MVRRRSLADRALHKRFERAIAEGDLPSHLDAGDLAEYLIIILRGMAVQAASGASRQQLQRVAEIALQAWPRRSPRDTVEPT